MSNNSNGSGIVSLLQFVTFAVFIAAKVAGGSYIATWSWWWILLPQVPVCAGLLRHFGVL